MSPNLARLAIKLSLSSTLIYLPALLSGLQFHTAGQLVIQSTPHQGASIYINQKLTSQQTNATFVVSPGTYWVAVTGGPDNLNCGGDSGKASVTAGGTLTLTCAKGSSQFEVQRQ
jgi:hypothetical protein